MFIWDSESYIVMWIILTMGDQLSDALQKRTSIILVRFLPSSLPPATGANIRSFSQSVWQTKPPFYHPTSTEARSCKLPLIQIVTQLKTVKKSKAKLST
jgi:hypothetical protein